MNTHNRAPFQVLIIPYRENPNTQSLEFCILKRSDENYWQFVAGGGENNEPEIISAERELFEETGLRPKSIFKLDSLTMIPVVNISGFLWGPETLLIPEYCFLANIDFTDEVTISNEHTDYKWVAYQSALSKLKWDSNKSAIWEANYRHINKIVKPNG
jgi:dATP pyrophosphohydrolase